MRLREKIAERRKRLNRYLIVKDIRLDHPSFSIIVSVNLLMAAVVAGRGEYKFAVALVLVAVIAAWYHVRWLRFQARWHRKNAATILQIRRESRKYKYDPDDFEDEE